MLSKVMFDEYNIAVRPFEMPRGGFFFLTGYIRRQGEKSNMFLWFSSLSNVGS